MKHIATLVTAIFLVAILSHVAAQPRLSFAETTYDYGVLQESDGFVASKFSFTNTGDKPLIIRYANASCGCTTPSYPESPIAAGATATVEVTYNTYGRPGAFSKSIKLYSNDPSSPTTLHIRGSVTASTSPAIDASEYPFNIGGLQLKNTHIPFFQLTNTEQKSKNIDFINSHDKPIRIEVTAVPPHLTASISPKNLEPKQEGILHVGYHTAKTNDWGLRQDSILLSVYEGKKLLAEKYITLSANITEDFSALTPQERADAPQISLNKKVIELAQIAKGSSQTCSVTITNQGNTPLVVRKVTSTSPHLTTQLLTTTIEPQQQIELSLLLHTSKLEGKTFDYRIQLISNDPQTPISTIRVVGDIK